MFRASGHFIRPCMHAYPYPYLGVLSVLSVVTVLRLLEEKICCELLVLVACEVGLDDEIALEAEKA